MNRDVMTAIAFFDMDHTILSQSSARLYLRYLWRRKDVRLSDVLRAHGHALLYLMGFIDYASVAAKLAACAADCSVATAQAQGQQWFDDLGARYLAEPAVQRMEEHRNRGHRVTIASASTQFVVGPVATHLGIAEYLCTRLETVNGFLTGRIIEPPCYGVGKTHLANEYAARYGARLDECHFYSDAYSDRPLLEQVGRPVAVNPDRRLRRLAVERGWPIERFY